MNEPIGHIDFRPIGLVHSPLREPAGAPIQSVAAKNVAGVVEVYPSFAAGLKDVEGFSHLILLYHLHLSRRFRLRVTPFLDSTEHGVFSTRSPSRPNPIGMSVVEVLGVTGRMIRVRGLDVVDGTPLLDIKPYVPAFDAIRASRVGWYAGRIAGARIRNIKADGRFVRSAQRLIRSSRSRE